MGEHNFAITVLILSIVIAIVFPILFYFAVSMPADIQFNRDFSSHERMAHDSASFEKMRDQIMIIWNKMNQTWHADELETTYCSWFGPDQNYENSLLATNDYYNGLIDRVNATIQEAEQIRVGNKTIIGPYNTYYQQQLDAFRNETHDAGGLLWAIRGAWYLKFAILQYFWWIPMIIIGIVCALSAIGSFLRITL